MTRSTRRGLLAAALLLAFRTTALAHDPGLSALDIRVEDRQIVAELALAAADAAGLDDAGDFVLRAIVVRLDGVELRGEVKDVSSDPAGIRVRVRYERTAGEWLAVRSAVPGRLARGHRELLSIKAPDGVLLAERMLDAASGEIVVELGAEADAAGTAARFFALGVEHILGGYDHLLFLAALLVAVRGRGELIRTVTAFTAAHSLTLGASVLWGVSLPAAVVEPLIAASIVYVGVENLLRPGVPDRWKLTFAFGLVHGFGFAAALRDLGIGPSNAAVPLASFNLGVEAGQLAVAGLFLPILWRLSARSSLAGRLKPACSAVVVLAGSFWLIERALG